MLPLHKHKEQPGRVHEEHIPSISPQQVQFSASGTNTAQVKKPQAACLDGYEVTKDGSGMGSGFSFTTSS